MGRDTTPTWPPPSRGRKVFRSHILPLPRREGGDETFVNGSVTQDISRGNKFNQANSESRKGALES
jgi:hypothetical protein